MSEGWPYRIFVTPDERDGLARLQAREDDLNVSEIYFEYIRILDPFRAGIILEAAKTKQRCEVIVREVE